MRSVRTRLAAVVLAVLFAVIGGAAAPGRAGASPTMASLLQDDDRLVYGSYAGMDHALTTMKALGVDGVRVTLLWKAVAPARRPRHASDPRAYRAVKWDPYDNLVRAAAGKGLFVDFVVSGPGPRWTQAKANSPRNQKSWKPRARDFQRFFAAVGRRYSGSYRDENQGHGVLPRVSTWEVWNEPNQPGWLMPQAQRKSHAGIVPMAPALYRGLLVASAKALLSTGHQNDLVMFGATAPIGDPPRGERKPLRPALFLRELFCLNRRLHRYRGRAARVRGCSGVGRLSILKRFPRLAYSHHPYTKKVSPMRPERRRDVITIANIAALPKLLDGIASATRLIPRGLPILSTEFGYETRPPDPYQGIGLARQAEWMNEGDYLAYREPRLFANAQLLLYDAPPLERFPKSSKFRWFTYQSGVYFADGKPKPSLGAYAFPFVPSPLGGGNWLFWGWVRFTPNGTTQTVTLQRKPPGSTTWENARTLQVTNASGFFETTLPAQSGWSWRAVWIAPDGSSGFPSREVTLQ